MSFYSISSLYWPDNWLRWFLCLCIWQNLSDLHFFYFLLFKCNFILNLEKWLKCFPLYLVTKTLDWLSKENQSNIHIHGYPLSVLKILSITQRPFMNANKHALKRNLFTLNTTAANVFWRCSRALKLLSFLFLRKSAIYRGHLVNANRRKRTTANDLKVPFEAITQCFSNAIEQDKAH